jgi:hypothetical protein
MIVTGQGEPDGGSTENPPKAYRNSHLEPEPVPATPEIASHVYAAVYRARQRLKMSLLIKGVGVAETEGNSVRKNNIYKSIC